MPAARAITSTWPFVTGSYEPGQLGLGTRIGLDHEETVLGEHRRQVARELGLEVGEHRVRRIDEHEIVTPACSPLGRERLDGVRAQDGRAREPESVEVALDGAR